MSRKFLLFSLALSVIGTLLLHLFPLIQNNFYFTMDQGRDAVIVRELLTRGKLLTVGPESSIPGVYHGVGWYYFLSVGFILFGGNPSGAVWILIATFVGALCVFLTQISGHLSYKKLLVLVVGLLTFWPWYESSSYAFNPFVLIPLSLLAVSYMAGGSKKGVLFAAVTVGASFHAHILGALCLSLWYLAAGSVLSFKKRTHILDVLKGVGIISLFFIPHLVSEITTGFPQWHAFLKEVTSSHQFLGALAPTDTLIALVTLLGENIIPFSFIWGIIVFCITTLLYIFTKPIHSWTRSFIFLSLGLWVVSLLFFMTNASWRSWVTVYLPPLLYISTLLMLFSVRRMGKIGAILLISLHLFYFGQRYTEVNTNDPSLLVNELRAIDWVYQKASGEGFSSYHYLPSVLDYPYQYLFWWHGKNTYGYLPCEYASFPGSPKLFIPGKKYYETPTKPCEKNIFLIVEPNEKNPALRQDWLEQNQTNSTHQDETILGTIMVQMRQKK